MPSLLSINDSPKAFLVFLGRIRSRNVPGHDSNLYFELAVMIDR